MRFATCIPVVVVLASCAVVPPQAWTFDSTRQQSTTEPGASELALADQVARLRSRRNEIREQIAAEPDIWKRLGLYARLHDVGMQLSPLERHLTNTPAR